MMGFCGFVRIGICNIVLLAWCVLTARRFFYVSDKDWLAGCLVGWMGFGSDMTLHDMGFIWLAWNLAWARCLATGFGWGS